MMRYTLLERTVFGSPSPRPGTRWQPTPPRSRHWSSARLARGVHSLRQCGLVRVQCPRATDMLTPRPAGSRAAERRSRPSSSSSSAKKASTPATIRPAAVEVSIPLRSERSAMSLSAKPLIVVITSAAFRPWSMPTTMVSPGRASASSLSRPGRCSRAEVQQLVAVDVLGPHPVVGELVDLLIQRLVIGADPGVAEQDSGGGGHALILSKVSHNYNIERLVVQRLLRKPTCALCAANARSSPSTGCSHN